MINTGFAKQPPLVPGIFTPPKKVWDRLIDQAIGFDFDLSQQIPRDYAQSGIVPVLNNSGYDIPQFGIVGLDGPIIQEWNTTSSTSNTISAVSQSFTVPAGLPINTGDVVFIDAGGGHSMAGAVTSYSGTNLVVLVTAINGSGTFSSWAISCNLNQFQQAPTFSVVKPTLPQYAGKFGITLEPIPENNIGMAIVSGIAIVQVTVDPSNIYDWAEVKDSDNGSLQNVQVGSARILYLSSSGGTLRWAIVRLGDLSQGINLNTGITVNTYTNITRIVYYNGTTILGPGATDPTTGLPIQAGTVLLPGTNLTGGGGFDYNAYRDIGNTSAGKGTLYGPAGCTLAGNITGNLEVPVWQIYAIQFIIPEGRTLKQLAVYFTGPDTSVAPDRDGAHSMFSMAVYTSGGTKVQYPANLIGVITSDIVLSTVPSGGWVRCDLTAVPTGGSIWVCCNSGNTDMGSQTDTANYPEFGLGQYPSLFPTLGFTILDQNDITGATIIDGVAEYTWYANQFSRHCPGQYFYDIGGVNPCSNDEYGSWPATIAPWPRMVKLYGAAPALAIVLG